MSGRPYRLAIGGSRIDRTRKLAFSFDGRNLSGFAGDTVASAVLASGQRVFGRSFKYHRPRGVVGLGSEEMNALIGVGLGAHLACDEWAKPDSSSFSAAIFLDASGSSDTGSVPAIRVAVSKVNPRPSLGKSVGSIGSR